MNMIGRSVNYFSSARLLRTNEEKRYVPEIAFCLGTGQIQAYTRAREDTES